MQTITEFLLKTKTQHNQNNQLNKWIAIDITTAKGRVLGKNARKQFVTSVNQYKLFKDKKAGYYYDVMDLIELSEECPSVYKANTYIKIDKQTKKKFEEGDKYLLYTETLVPLTRNMKIYENGQTIWELGKNYKICCNKIHNMFYFLLTDANDLFKDGDLLTCIDLDTCKKYPSHFSKIDFICDCNLDEFEKVFKNTFPDYCKNNLLPWKKFSQVYFVKGILINE